jgi:hypothetical protein
LTSEQKRHTEQIQPSFANFVHSGLITQDELLEIETALGELLAHGYGSLEITVERNVVTGYRQILSERFGKFKNFSL